MLLHAFVDVCTPLTGAPAEASLARERESDSGENERRKKKEYKGLGGDMVRGRGREEGGLMTEGVCG